MSQKFVAESEPDLSAIWSWFEFQIKLIGGERRRFRLVLQGRMSSDELDPVLRAQLLGLNEAETDKLFEDQRRELEFLTMLALLATAEAILRIDFDRRVTNRLKDPLSRKYRETRRKRKDRIRLDEDLLETLQTEVNPRSIVSEFRAALKLRHWLAHGSHWHPKLGRDYLPADIFDISIAVIETLG